MIYPLFDVYLKYIKTKKQCQDIFWICPCTTSPEVEREEGDLLSLFNVDFIIDRGGGHKSIALSNIGYNPKI